MPRRIEDRIYASGTTLGADNGVGAALMLAILSSTNSRIPISNFCLPSKKKLVYTAPRI
jgi:hypothetical protein